MKQTIIGIVALVAAIAFIVVIIVVFNKRQPDRDEEETQVGYTQIDGEKVKEMMDADDGHVVLDVRQQDEYDEGHIPGAILLPNEDIGKNKPAELPDKDQVILVYGRDGKEAAQKLRDLGYSKVYEFGDLGDWTGPIAKNVEVTFKNEATEGDIWLLPATEENKKTTLWGKATIPESVAGESRTATVEMNAGMILFRAIDADGVFYEANDIVVEEGYSVVFRWIKENDTRVIEVYDANGDAAGTYNVFFAML